MTETQLSGKHEQTLVSVYKKLDWLLDTFDDSLFMEVPSHLKNSHQSLRCVLLDCGVLENNFSCPQCGRFEWSSERAGPGINDCSSFDGFMQRISTRVAE